MWCGISTGLAQQTSPVDTFHFTREEAENRFLQENLFLIAKKLSISQAEAKILQAKLWPNPTLTIDQVNLWATDSQVEEFGEGLPPFFNNFGRNQQIGVQLEQVMLTAGKRKKMVAIETVSKEIAGEYFQDLLRNLKTEFRNYLTQIQYYQAYQNTYRQQLTSIQTLISAYQNQVQLGNIGKGEYIRLQALSLEIRKELTDLQLEINDIQQQLKVLMNLPAESSLQIAEEGFLPDLEKINRIQTLDLQNLALTNRPDLKAAKLEQTYYENQYAYERAQRVPDLTFSAGYDRGGSFMLNFIGVGVAFDIPVFNRNQGNIKYAQIGIEKSRILTDASTSQVQNEVENIYQDIQATLELYNTIGEGYEAELDQLLQSYTQNFANRNISLLQYLDFFNAYLENKKTILDAEKELNLNLEELQYTIGIEIE